MEDLKENYNAVAVKTEFETEGATKQEALLLKKMAELADLDFTLKIGGCGALKDLCEAKEIGVNTIVAPMIESAYAAEKFFKTINVVYSEAEFDKIKFFINIETKLGVDNIEEILSSDISDNITGIVLGRTDLAGSLKMRKEDVNNRIIFDYAKLVSEKALKYNKELIVGGGITPSSLSFLVSLPLTSVNMYETRKIVFDAQKSLGFENSGKGLLKAFEFELLWLKNKQNILDEDVKRIAMLENQLASLMVL